MIECFVCPQVVDLFAFKQKKVCVNWHSFHTWIDKNINFGSAFNHYFPQIV